MKIAHINFDYGSAGMGGAGIAASRLHRSMLAAGIDSHFFCTFAREPGKQVYVMPERGLSRFLFLNSVKLLRHTPRLFGTAGPIPQNIIPSGMAAKINALNPDAVVVHWISADVLSFKELVQIKAPLYIYLHDFWMLGGNEPYFESTDQRFIDGYTRQNSGFWVQRLWQQKRALFDTRPDTCFVAPSEWGKGLVQNSNIGKKHKCAVIVNPVDLDEFTFEELPEQADNAFVIVFGGYGGSRNRFKGFTDLVAALETMPAEKAKGLKVQVFGEIAQPYYVNGIEVSFLGQLRSIEALRDAYRNADLLAFPSKKETQGQTKAEAMSCGLPVVAFDRTACAEGIIHQETGWIAPDGDIESFRDGILWWRERMKQPDWSSVRRNISSHAHGIYGATAVIEAWGELLRSSSREDLSQRH